MRIAPAYRVRQGKPGSTSRLQTTQRMLMLFAPIRELVTKTLANVCAELATMGARAIKCGALDHIRMAPSAGAMADVYRWQKWGP
jgi:hypothetical protein